MSLTFDQIETLAKQAGLSAKNAEVAAAIAMAESQGNPNDHNPTPPDDSYGLWQINMFVGTDPHTGKHVNLGPPRRALYGLKANTDLYDPTTNAKVMSAISAQGQNFSAWTTYTSGEYKQYLSTASAGQVVGDALGATSGASIISDAADAASTYVGLATKAGDALTKTAAWVSSEKNWVRVAYVALGLVLVTTATVGVVKSTPPGKAATKVGKVAVKTGVSVVKTGASVAKSASAA